MPTAYLAHHQKNLSHLTLIINFFYFYAPVSAIYGIVTFYQLFDNIFLAFLPLIIFEILYVSLVPLAAKLVGRIGIKQSLIHLHIHYRYISIPRLSLSPNPIYPLLTYLVRY